MGQEGLGRGSGGGQEVDRTGGNRRGQVGD